MFTFETQWPAPFSRDWQASAKRFETAKDAAQAAIEWMIISFENGTTVAVRLKEVKE